MVAQDSEPAEKPLRAADQRRKIICSLSAFIGGH
jgi:hypothetical protein